MTSLLSLLPFDRGVEERFRQDTPDLRRRARLVAAFGLLGSFGGVGLAASHYLWFEIPAVLCIPPLLAGLTILLVPALLLRVRALRASGHILAGCWFVAIGWGVFIRGGLASPPVMCQAAVPLIAMAIIDRRAGLPWLVAVCLQIGTYALLQLAGVPVPDRMAAVHHVTSNLVAASLFGGLLVAMVAAQDWLTVKAQEEAAVAQKRQVAAEREAQILRADRLASIGQLAAGLAHEINNPLSYILTNVELLHESKLPGELAEVAADALDGARRVKTIVHDLKTFSRSDGENLAPVDLQEVIASSLRIVAGEVKHRATLRTELEACPPVLAEATHLGQIVVNLVVNASQAMSDDPAAPREIVVRLDTDPAGKARLSVRDTGKGIPPEVMARVTEPFFTTKPVGVGTGLGLFVCDNLVRRFGGEMKIESQVGVGSTFTITLPPLAVDREARGADAAHPAEPRPPGQLRILVVDDDAAILRALGRRLRTHQVVTASNGREALECLRTCAELDLVLCDLTMPEVSGVEVARALESSFPALVSRVVFMTGGVVTDEAREFLATTRYQVVQKPIDAGGLANLVAAAASRRDDAASTKS